MPSALYTVAKGGLPQSSDVNQLVQGLTGAIDIGVVSIAAPSANPTTAPTSSANGPGNLTGTYGWAFVDLTGDYDSAGNFHETGSTLLSPVSTALALSANAALVSLPSSTNSLAKRRGIYRNLSTGSATTGPFYLVTTVDIGTLSVPDNTPDANLTTAAPTTNSTGSFLQFPGLSAYPPVLAAGTVIVLNNQLNLSNGVAWLPVGSNPLTSPSSYFL